MTEKKAPRKDAVANREKLLEAADRLFMKGLDAASLKDVAREAGVGIGTAYRHFPTKEDLIDELFSNQLGCVTDGAQLAADTEDAWSALVTYIEASLAAQRWSCGLRQFVLDPTYEHDAVRKARASVDPLLQTAIDRAKVQGTLREDFELEDLTQLQVAIGAIMDASEEENPGFYKRYLGIFLDGMRRH